MNLSFITITVKSLEESLKFYTEVLNFREFRRFSPNEGVNIVFLRDEQNGMVELIEYENISESQQDNLKIPVSIGISVESLDAVIKMLKEKNISIVRGPIEVPGGIRFVFVQDPNGVEIEFIEGFSK